MCVVFWKKWSALKRVQNHAVRARANLPVVEVSFDALYGWATDGLETMVQYGYPFPADVFGPLPAYPYRAACLAALGAPDPLQALAAALQVA